MENIIADIVQKFEEGKIDRRQLIKNLAMAASAGSVLGSTSASAAGAPGFQATDVNHLSMTVPNYAKTRDFYSDLLGLKVSNDDGKTRCSLTGGAFRMQVRNGPVTTPLIDHFGVTIENFNKPAVEAELKRRGLNPQTAPGNEISWSVKDPDGYRIQLDKKR
jgi:catechol 2,3-dioxygenase-like lactoylglutathione lyase family enzyme